MTLTFRPATPADADAVAPLIAESSPNLTDHSLRFRGTHPKDFIRYDFLRGEGLFGHRWLVVAVQGEVIVGVLTVYPGARYRQVSLRTLLSAFRFFGFLRGWVVLLRSLQMAPLFAPPRTDSLFLANGYVVPEFRCQGVYAGLVEAAETMALEQGYRALECDVSFWNERVREVHEFFGFRIREERSYKKKGHALDGFRRMELDLATLGEVQAP